MNADQVLSSGVFVIALINLAVVIRIQFEQRRWRKETLAILDKLGAHIKTLDEYSQHILDAYKEFRGDDWWRKE